MSLFDHPLQASLFLSILFNFAIHAPTDNDANVMFAIIGHKIRSEEIKITNFYLTVPVASLVTSAVCIM